jgi:hypothetical protein
MLATTLPTGLQPRAGLRLCGRVIKCFPRQVLSSLVDTRRGTIVPELVSSRPPGQVSGCNATISIHMLAPVASVCSDPSRSSDRCPIEASTPAKRQRLPRTTSRQGALRLSGMVAHLPEAAPRRWIGLHHDGDGGRKRDATLLAICNDRTYRPIALTQARPAQHNRPFDASHHVSPLGRCSCSLWARWQDAGHGNQSVSRC